MGATTSSTTTRNAGSDNTSLPVINDTNEEEHQQQHHHQRQHQLSNEHHHHQQQQFRQSQQSPQDHHQQQQQRDDEYASTITSTNNNNGDDNSNKNATTASSSATNNNNNNSATNDAARTSTTTTTNNNDANTTTTNTTTSPNNENTNNNTIKLSSNSLLYCVESYYGVYFPVCVTMILSSLAVLYINTDETRQQGEQLYQDSYTVIDTSSENSTTTNLLASITNTLVIVLVICGLTFGVVLLYKFQCMKVLIGYLLFTTTTLLGYESYAMIQVVIHKYNLTFVDKPSLFFVLYNYAMVGTISIFYNKGIPKYVSQTYLILISVTLAWQLSYFNEWTAWTLLIMLALYDLFAVLTPCGPLKMLVELMNETITSPNSSSNNAGGTRSSSASSSSGRQGSQSTSRRRPELPSLFFEANLPQGVKKPNKKNKTKTSEGDDTAANDNARIPQRPQQPQEASSVARRPTREPRIRTYGDDKDEVAEEEEKKEEEVVAVVGGDVMGESIEVTAEAGIQQTSSSSRYDPCTTTTATAATTTTTTTAVDIMIMEEDERNDILSRPTGYIPFAIAKMYKLIIIDEDGLLGEVMNSSATTTGSAGDRSLSLPQPPQQLPRIYKPEHIRQAVDDQDWTPQQLRSIVRVVFPTSGAKIQRKESGDEESVPNHRNITSATSTGDISEEYEVYNRNGDILTTYVVNEEGKVMRVVKRKGSDNDEEDNSSIKLGLVSLYFIHGIVQQVATSSDRDVLFLTRWLHTLSLPF